MRIFLSYASEDRALAERVMHSLRGRGHRVFFDRSDLPGGDSYEHRIEEAVAKSDGAVFLISPDSVAPGRFTRTELDLIERKWKVARRRVLPVMARPTPMDDIPAYLRSVSILEPAGDIPAETAAAVGRLSRLWTRALPRAAAAVVVAALAVAAGLYVLDARGDRPRFEIAAEAPVPWERGLFDRAERHAITYSVANTGNIAGRLLDVTLETRPEAALRVADAGPERGADGRIVAPGARADGYFHVEPPAGGAPAEWRLCAHSESAAQTCTPYQTWESGDGVLYGDAFPIPDEIASRATAVAWLDGAWLVGARAPNQLVRLTGDGAVAAARDLPGPPTALSAGPLGLYVGLAGADAVHRLDPETLETVASAAIAFPPDLRGTFGEPLSATPTNLAQSGDALWIRTEGGGGASGLAFASADLSDIRVPAQFDDISFDLDGVRLRSGPGAVWSGNNNTSPASIYRFGADGITVFGGHDYDIASCATDVLPDGGELLVPDCDGRLQRAVVSTGRVSVLDQVDVILGYGTDMDTWTTVSVVRAPDGQVLAASESRPRAADEGEVMLERMDSGAGSKILFDAAGVRLIDLAAGPDAALLLLEDDRGRRQLVSPGHGPDD